jgi:hypothetical protein
MAFITKLRAGDTCNIQDDGRALRCPGCGRTSTVRSKYVSGDLQHTCFYCKTIWERQPDNWKSTIWGSEPQYRIVRGNEKWHTNWIRVRDRVVKRAGGRCEECGTERPNLQVHHIVPVSAWGRDDEDNLLVLCKTCHSDMH